MKKMNIKELTKLAKRAKEVLDQLEAQKVLYKELDELTEALCQSPLVLPHILLGAGIQIVDNFRDKNAVFRPACVRRFEIKKVG